MRFDRQQEIRNKTSSTEKHLEVFNFLRAVEPTVMNYTYDAEASPIRTVSILRATTNE